MVSTKLSKKKSKPFRPKLYSIQWEDIVGASGWHSANDIRKSEPSIVNSICFIFSQDKKLTKTFGSYIVDKDDGEEIITYGDVNTIPTSNIKECTEIIVSEN